MNTQYRLPRVAIVGRPNVGKSSLFNALVGRRISIVDQFAGLTRDYISAKAKYDDREFELLDTGGIGIEDKDGLSKEVEHQIDLAIGLADLVVFVIDFKEGLVSIDHDIAARLRKLKCPVLVAVNKADHPKFDDRAMVYCSLGFGDPVTTSTRGMRGIQGLLERLDQMLPVKDFLREDPFPNEMKLAVVGKRNSGKSTLINTLAGEERVIVSEIPGTTRDMVDVRFTIDDKSFIAIDTAGLRKARSVDGSIEFYCQSRAHEAIRRADVVLFLIDAYSEISQVDKKLAAVIVETNKPVLLAINKWDMAGKTITTGKYLEYLAERLHGLAFAPTVFISAKEGTRIKNTVQVAMDLYDQANTRVGTGEFNRILQAAATLQVPSEITGKRPKIYYGTQTGVLPPTFALFVNRPASFTKAYRRFLENFLRKNLPFKEVPLRIFFRARSQTEIEGLPETRTKKGKSSKNKRNIGKNYKPEADDDSDFGEN